MLGLPALTSLLLLPSVVAFPHLFDVRESTASATQPSPSTTSLPDSALNVTQSSSSNSSLDGLLVASVIQVHQSFESALTTASALTQTISAIVTGSAANSIPSDLIAGFVNWTANCSAAVNQLTATLIVGYPASNAGYANASLSSVAVNIVAMADQIQDLQVAQSQFNLQFIPSLQNLLHSFSLLNFFYGDNDQLLRAIRFFNASLSLLL